MYPIERTGWFFLKLVVIYVLLLLPWWGVAQRGYAPYYRWIANRVYGSLGSVGSARFEPLEEASGRFDSQMVIKCVHFVGKRSTRDVPFFTRRIGYLPTAQVAALILATSIPWRRKWIMLLLGLVLIQAFIMLEVGLTVLYSLTDVRLPVFDIEPSTSRFVARLYEMTVISPTLSFIIPILIWLLFCFRRDDWQRVAESIRARRAGSDADGKKPRR